jgi:hypothetical protein
MQPVLRERIPPPDVPSDKGGNDVYLKIRRVLASGPTPRVRGVQGSQEHYFPYCGDFLVYFIIFF